MKNWIKKLKINIMVSTISFFILTTVQCKKQEITPSSNIVLYNQPLNIIQANIKGSWQLSYVKGGFCAVCPPRKVGYIFFDFMDHDRVVLRDTNFVWADTKIDWIYSKDTFGDYIYILNFFAKDSVPCNYIVDRIINDTLILMDNSFDYQTYFLIKSN